jgi:hypothetical protein
MTRDRFEALAEAFGGSVARWPAAEREAAAALMAAEPDFAREVLAQAEALDAALDAWPRLTVGHEFREAVIAQAGQGRARAGLRGWLWRAGAGAGLAAACAAGLVMGVTLYGRQAPSATDEPISAVMASYDLPITTQASGDAT